MGQNKLLTLGTNGGGVVCCWYAEQSVGEQFCPQLTAGSSGPYLKHFYSLNNELAKLSSFD